VDDQTRYTGTIKFYKKDNAYGFASVDAEGKETFDVFFHLTKFNNRIDVAKLIAGAKIEFVVGKNDNGFYASKIDLL
jgi:cold shock CspA family protein